MTISTRQGPSPRSAAWGSAFALPPAGDYYRQGLADVPFSRTPKPRWESLHPIMGLAELHYATGETDYRKAFENLWWSMLEGDRHNNGGFSSGERANGNPYLPGAIETLTQLKEQGIPYVVLTNGSAYPPAEQAAKLAQTKGVLAVTKDEARNLNTSSTPDFTPRRNSSSRRTSATVRTPPPTVSGMKTCAATASMMGRMRSRPSLVAVMSRKVSSSAPCSL